MEGKWRQACGLPKEGTLTPFGRDAAECHALCSKPSSQRWAAVGREAPGCIPGTQVSLPALQGHVMDRRKKALTDYRKLRAFFAEEEERFLQEADKEEGSPEDEDADPAERFGSLLQAVSELERRHRNLGLSMLLQVGTASRPNPRGGSRGSTGTWRASDQPPGSCLGLNLRND